MKRICKIEGCDKPIKGYGYCSKHYQRLKRNGHTDLVIEYKGPRKDNPKEYSSWSAMRDRCLCKTHHAYNDYGGRGIKICKRWLGAHGFRNFLEDMGPRPSGMSLDRIDNNGDYCPENCRWATQRVQCCNKRNNRKIPGVTPSYGCSTWLARYRARGKNLRKACKTYEEAVEQRLSWEKKYPLD